MYAQQREVSPGHACRSTSPLPLQPPERLPQGYFAQSSSPVRVPQIGPPAGWQASAASLQGRNNLDTLQVLLAANLLEESPRFRRSARRNVGVPVESTIVAVDPEMRVGGSSPSTALPPASSETYQGREAMTSAPEKHGTGADTQAVVSSTPRPFTFGHDSLPSEVRTESNASNDVNTTQEASLAALQNRFESSWKMLQGSFERMIGLGTVPTSSSFFAACTKVPGPLASGRGGDARLTDPGEFNLNCLNVENSILHQQREDGLDAVLPLSRQCSYPSALPTRWYVKTSPPTHASAQSGGAQSGLLGYSEPASNSSSSGATFGGNLADAQTSGALAHCTDRRRMLAAHEVQDIMLGNKCFMHSKKGNKSNAPNQDRAICASMGAAELYAVFDGHGEHGHFSSELCNDVLPKLLLRAIECASPCGVAESGDPNPQDAAGSVVEWREAAISSFLQTHSLLEDVTLQFLQNAAVGSKDSKMPLLDARASGTTATVVLLAGDRSLAAHAGDSRAVLGLRPRGSLQGAWRVTELTQDHKPDLPEERARIERAGSQIILSGQPPNQVQRIYTPQQPWPMINMTRSLGDLHAHSQGLSAEAEVNVFQRLWDPSTDEAVLLICSDGVWDVIDSDFAVDYAAEQLQRGMDPANRLAQEAYLRWSQRGLPGNYSDDITVVAKFF